MSHRGEVVSNKLCADVWDHNKYRKHRNRLTRVKPVIDTGGPTIYKHLVTRAKKEQLLEERYAQIENDNRVLLKKMSHIMRTRQVNPVAPERGFRTLNAVARKKETIKIMQENQAILKRIQQRRPTYNREDWDTHQQDHVRYLMNLKEKTNLYPAKLLGDSSPRSSTAPQLEDKSEGAPNTARLPKMKKPKKPKTAKSSRGGRAAKKVKKIGPPPVQRKYEPKSLFSGKSTIGDDVACILTVDFVKNYNMDGSKGDGYLIRAVLAADGQDVGECAVAKKDLSNYYDGDQNDSARLSVGLISALSIKDNKIELTKKAGGEDSDSDNEESAI